MPYARIEVPVGLPAAVKTGILDGVDDALVEALGVPPRDAYLRLFEYHPELTRIPRRHGPLFSFVEIQMFPGRTPETKARLYRLLAGKFDALGIPPADLTIALVEIPQADWGVRGGLPATQVDHGFTIAV